MMPWTCEMCRQWPHKGIWSSFCYNSYLVLYIWFFLSIPFSPEIFMLSLLQVSILANPKWLSVFKIDCKTSPVLLSHYCWSSPFSPFCRESFPPSSIKEVEKRQPLILIQKMSEQELSREQQKSCVFF